MNTLSCGIIIINSKNQILGCLPYGRKDKRLDLPKGGIEEGECELDAAIRETFEETGIKVPKESLKDLGRFEYIKTKDLHLFTVRCDVSDLGELFCSTYFDSYGRKVPEVVGYEWVDLDDISSRFFTPLTKILNKIINGQLY